MTAFWAALLSLFVKFAAAPLAKAAAAAGACGSSWRRSAEKVGC